METTVIEAVPVSWLSISGLTAGIVSVILGLAALGISAIFFVSAKNSERAIASALEGIRAQTTTLSEISTRHLRDLTKVISRQVQQPEPTSETIVALTSAITGVLEVHRTGFIEQDQQERTVSGTTIQGHNIPLLQDSIDKNILREWAITMFLTLYYYTAYANYFAQSFLPSETDYNEANDFDRLVRQLLDMSANDFRVIAAALDQWVAQEPEFVRNHRLYQAFGVQGQLVQSLVRSARQQFELQAGTQPQP